MQTLLGHVSRKRFGQHFLQDSRIIETIVSIIQPRPTEAMVEIGPGLGALTNTMVKYVDHLTVIEIDRDLAAHLAEHTTLKNKVSILHKNAMNTDFMALSDTLGQRIRVFGNLPYNISTPIMFHLFNHRNSIIDMYFMLQKEVVDRLVSEPNCKTYGRLSVMAQYYCKINRVLEVPASAFRPRPRIQSTVVRLVPYTMPLRVHDIRQFITIINLAFHQRRKKLRNSLSAHFREDTLVQLGIDPNLRAENLKVEHYCRLSNALTNS